MYYCIIEFIKRAGGRGRGVGDKDARLLSVSPTSFNQN